MKPKASKSIHRWHGAVEGMYNGLLYGWALDRELPHARVVLEVCLDDQIVGSVIADVARPDLADTFNPGAVGGDVCHGFVADLGVPQAGDSGSLTVRVANTSTVLAGSIVREAPELPPAPALGGVFSDGALRLHGWARAPQDEARQLTVRAYLGQQPVAETVANMEHPALRSRQVGAHGFDLALPMSLADGAVHLVRVLDENQNELAGSPVTVCCHADGIAAMVPQRDQALQQLAEAYERHLPRSLGLAHYPAWNQRFEAPGAVPPSQLRAALLLVGSGTPQELQRSVASARQQYGSNVRLFGADNGGAAFSQLLQQALQSGCDVIGCLRIGDTLPPHAIGYALEGFKLPGTHIVYTDSEQAGQPWFKPAWNLDYALGSDYPLELLLVRSGTLRRLPQLPEDAAGFAWQALAAHAAQGDDAIVHVPRVLYHFHSPLSAGEQAARCAAAQQAISASEPGTLLQPFTLPHGTLATATRRVQRTLSAGQRATTVSLVIPTRDSAAMLERCISTLQRHTQWDQLEIIVIDNGSVEKATKAYFRKIAKQGVKVLAMPGPFNFSDLNNRAISAASGEVIGLVNNDIEALHDGWLDEIMAQLLRPGVGAVGAKLLWPNGMVQHGGVLLGIGNVAGHYGNRLADGDWGDHGRNQLVLQTTGVTAACLFLRKADFFAVGGMDAHAFPVAFNDVDLCLKLRAAGKAIVWTPFARLLHAESASRGHEDTPQKKARAARELEQLRQRWNDVLLRDPAYHPSLNLDALSQPFAGLAMPPRDRSPRTGALCKEAP